MMMKIYIHSCHAALEYDQARLFQYMGHEVWGRFDVGSLQRPKVDGITDDCRDDFKGAECVVLHQTGDFDMLAVQYAQKGMKVIVMAFGQGSDTQYIKLLSHMQKDANIWIVAYSLTCFNRINNIARLNGLIGEETHPRVRMIRFGKFLDDYDLWSGGFPKALVVCNDIQNRGSGCGFQMVDDLFHCGIPLEVVGKNTDELEYGLGELSWDELRKKFATSLVMFVPGTIPAPYVMSMMEGLCTGIPVICYDNGCGIADEELWVKTVSSFQKAKDEIEMVLLDYEHRQWMSDLSKKIAENHFDNAIIQGQWKQLFQEVKGEIMPVKKKMPKTKVTLGTVRQCNHCGRLQVESGKKVLPNQCVICGRIMKGEL